ncbi:MAG: hypothetical protein QE487_03865 [Fluviicola sp.]|nr:hypothetical protein [Fluviicola sp.]
MKALNTLTIILLFSIFSNTVFAVDRVVQQGGPVGTFASISAAITAATDGDLIIINNRTDGLPWLENLSVGKTLTFVSAVDNIQWWMEGTIAITMAEGRNVTIIGLRNTSASGTITKNGTTPVNRTVVNILYSDIAASIDMGTAGINFYLGSSKAGAVYYSYGKIYGNDIRSLACSSDAVSTEDVNQIIGNRIGLNAGGASTNALTYTSNTQYLYCNANYVRGGYNGILISSLKSGVTTNRVINCTMTSASGSPIPGNNFAGLSLTFTSGLLTVENSICCSYYVASNTGAHGIYATPTAQANTTFTYNMYYNSYFSGGFSPSSSLGNFASGSAILTQVNTADGSIAGTNHVNMGNPSNSDLDLDLSRNDIGVFGGSYSMANFLPYMSNVESSRVNFMNTPRVVNQGGTVSVQVIGYDK